jgi:hypothetical protein
MICRALAVLLSLLFCSALAFAQPTSQPGPASQAESAPAPLPPPPPPPPPMVPGVVSPHEAETVAEHSGRGSVIKEDLDVEKLLVRRGRFTLAMGGMIQVQGAFYVGNGARMAEKDPAEAAGFRIRRARFGLAGELVRDVGYYLAVDLKDTVVAALGGDRGSEILDAKIVWHRFPWLRVSAGLTKVPFSAFSLMSSSRMMMIERPLLASWLTPEYRAGMNVEGTWRGLQYAAGIFNGSEGATSGNRLAGVAGSFRLQYTIFDQPPSFVPRGFNLTVGGAYMIDDQPSVLIHRVAGGLTLRIPRATLMGELIWLKSKPHDAPATEADSGEVRRWGTAGELGVFLLPGRFQELLQAAFRYEYFKDSDLATFGKQQLFTAGLNAYFYQHNLKLQVNYIRRHELSGPQVPNDIGFAQLQAAF